MTINEYIKKLQRKELNYSVTIINEDDLVVVPRLAVIDPALDKRLEILGRGVIVDVQPIGYRHMLITVAAYG